MEYLKNLEYHKTTVFDGLKNNYYFVLEEDLPKLKDFINNLISCYPTGSAIKELVNEKKEQDVG